MTEPQTALAEHRFPCDNCGADFRFDPESESLGCDHCGNTLAIEGIRGNARALAELDLRRALDQDLPQAEMEETRVSQCPNCAAHVEFDADLHAAECPFCATPVVTDTGLHRHIKPKGVLPFAIGEKQARAAMTTWLGSLWFAPKGLQDYARKGRAMQGIYVPYWTFDAETATQYQGERGTVYYETQTVVRDGKRQQIQVPKVRWRAVRGRVSRFFDDVLVLASKSLPKRYTDALEPWDLSALEPYSPEYLAGFRAEGYQVELESAFAVARDHMERVIARDIKFDIVGDRQKVHPADTRLGQLSFKHILLPVWLAAYKYRGKTYRFVVNGRTGRVQGERPWSMGKILLAMLFAMIVAGLVGFGLALGEGGY